MKTSNRILALFLALLCVFTLVGCGKDNGDDPKAAESGTYAYVMEAMKASRPTKTATHSEYTIKGEDITLVGDAVLLVKVNGTIVEAKYSYDVQVLNPAGTVDENGKPLLVGNVKDTEYSKGNMTASFEPETGDAIYSVYSTQTKLADIKLPENAQISTTSDGATCLTVVLSAIESEAVFGRKINAVGSITYQVLAKDGRIVRFELSYETALGTMKLRTDYSYDKVSFDVVAPE
ncbi:MAG: hypothetical protein J6R42_02920 [Clostridia bacterium]|nr:hypothetical protein [Clostridia bacterium]